MPTPQKETLVSEIAETLRQSEAVLLADYRGLTVAQVSDLRRKLRDADANFAIVKNTLFKRATEGIFEPDTQLEETLNGPTAAAFAMKDPVSAAKVITDYIRDNRNTPLTIKGGLVGGRFYTPEQVNALSKVPPKEVLIAQMLGSLQSPISGLVGTLNGIVSNFVFTLQAVADQKQAQAG